ncbi:MAG: hypothetical protein KC561_17035, partial [Myxococcales bacterium]|nr:hypothetical protein [Myxococcales bacterium]
MTPPRLRWAAPVASGVVVGAAALLGIWLVVIFAVAAGSSLTATAYHELAHRRRRVAEFVDALASRLESEPTTVTLAPGAARNRRASTLPDDQRIAFTTAPRVAAWPRRWRAGAGMLAVGAICAGATTGDAVWVVPTLV